MPSYCECGHAWSEHVFVDTSECKDGGEPPDPDVPDHMLSCVECGCEGFEPDTSNGTCEICGSEFWDGGSNCTCDESI